MENQDNLNLREILSKKINDAIFQIATHQKTFYRSDTASDVIGYTESLMERFCNNEEAKELTQFIKNSDGIFFPTYVDNPKKEIRHFAILLCSIYWKLVYHKNFKEENLSKFIDLIGKMLNDPENQKQKDKMESLTIIHQDMVRLINPLLENQYSKYQVAMLKINNSIKKYNQSKSAMHD